MDKIFAFLLITLSFTVTGGCLNTSLEAETNVTQETIPIEVNDTENDDSIEMSEAKNEHTKEMEEDMKLKIGDSVYTATLVDNSTTEALKQMLSEGPVTIEMSDYGNMEKVGTLGKSLPRNDQQIRAEAGDLILYQGNAFVIYYAPNSWNFTRIGKINNVTKEELKKVLGSGNVTVTLSLD